MNKNLLTGLGALTGLVSMAGMIRLIDGAGLASTFSWIFLLLAMVPWVAYAAGGPGTASSARAAPRRCSRSTSSG